MLMNYDPTPDKPEGDCTSAVIHSKDFLSYFFFFFFNKKKKDTFLIITCTKLLHKKENALISCLNRPQERGFGSETNPELQHCR